MYRHNKQKEISASIIICMDHFSLDDMMIELFPETKWMNEGGQK